MISLQVKNKYTYLILRTSASLFNTSMGGSIIIGIMLLVHYNLAGLSDLLISSARTLQETQETSSGIRASFTNIYFNWILGYFSGAFILTIFLLSIVIPVKIFLNIPGFLVVTKLQIKKQIKNSDYKYNDFPSN